MAILDNLKNSFSKEDADEVVTPTANVIRKLCPKCHGCMLEFVKEDDYVTCHACDESTSVSELLSTAGGEAPVAAATAPVAPVIMVDSPESGLIYLENYFENYNWEAYNKTTRILIPEINSMVENNKIKQGAAPESWLLDFLSVSTPVKMKLKGLETLESEIADVYSATDNTAALQMFDRYKTITNALIGEKSGLIKRLENDVNFAKRQGLAADKLQEITDDLKSITEALGKLVRAEKLTALPLVAKKQKKIETDLIAEFRAKGIDVVAEYEKACKLYQQSGNDKRAALKIFETIRGYGESNEYIAKINRYFGYYKKFFNFYGKYYVYKSNSNANTTLDPADKGDKKGCFGGKGDKNTGNLEDMEGALYGAPTQELYEVINGEPANEPILRGITDIITYYGSVLYYVKYASKVCAFDMNTCTNTELLTVPKAEDLKLTGNNGKYYYFNKDASAMYILKRLEMAPIEEPGCLDKLRGKTPIIVEHRNNYAVYELNFAACACSCVIQQVVDMIASYGTHLFYTHAEELPEGQVETEETRKTVTKLDVMVMDTATHKSSSLFKEDCKIVGLEGSRIIYTMRKPNTLNMDLHVFDFATKKDVVVEKNIYSYLKVQDGRLYYRVGNKHIAPLFSNNLEGTDRIEIMTHHATVVAIAAGWIYVNKGAGRNQALYKISSDGKQSHFICSQLKDVVKITDSYIYYITVDGALRVVRSDGCDNTFISGNIDSSRVQIDEDYIYFLRRESVNSNDKNYSLYRMDIDGHNLCKLLFNVNSMKNFDEKTLYVEMSDRIRFHIFCPAPRQKDEREYDETFPLTKYYKYNKQTGDLENVLTIGMPHPDKYEAKGCLGRKKELQSIFTEIPIEDDFEKQGERAGAVAAEQISEQAALNNAAEEENANNNGCSGCSGGKSANSGCLKRG